MRQLYLLVPMAPLAGAIVVGLFGPRLGRAASHWLCILGVAIATVASFVVWRDVMAGHTLQRRHLHVAALRRASSSRSAS